MKTVPIALLHSKFAYDPSTGVFKWRTGGHRVNIGDTAGSLGKHGYRYLYVDGELFRASRVAWAMSYSVWPEQELDHINRDRADDRLANLREASRVQNTHNVSVKRTSSSGVKGVTLTKNGKRWEANITFERKRSYLGTFDSPEEAAAAYRAASLRLVNEFTA